MVLFVFVGTGQGWGQVVCEVRRAEVVMVGLRGWKRGCVSVKKHSSPMFSGVDGRALEAALLHRRKLRDPLFRALLHAKSMRSVHW